MGGRENDSMRGGVRGHKKTYEKQTRIQRRIWSCSLWGQYVPQTSGSQWPQVTEKGLTGQQSVSKDRDVQNFWKYLPPQNGRNDRNVKGASFQLSHKLYHQEPPEARQEQSPICLLILVYTKNSINIGLEMGLLIPPHYYFLPHFGKTQKLPKPSLCCHTHSQRQANGRGPPHFQLLENLAVSLLSCPHLASCGQGASCICRAGVVDQKSLATYTFTESAQLCDLGPPHSPLRPRPPVRKRRRWQVSAAFPSNFRRHLPEGEHADTVPQCVLVGVSLERCSHLPASLPRSPEREQHRWFAG